MKIGTPAPISLILALSWCGVGHSADERKGMASFYSKGQRVACGGRFDPQAMTAAHRTLPCGTRVEVTNPRNGRKVVVTINDRGPRIRSRDIDLSLGAARELGATARGVFAVTYRVVPRLKAATPFESRFRGCLPWAEDCERGR